MKNKDQILLENLYNSIHENLNIKSNRLDFNNFLDGGVKLNSYYFTVPAEFFPQDVLEKYSKSYGWSMEEIQSEGVSFDDVSFGADVETDSDEWGQYHGPSIRHHRETYVSGIILVSWQFRDQEEENVFTSEDKNAEEKMNLAIEKHLQEHIDENLNKFEKQAEKNAVDNY